MGKQGRHFEIHDKKIAKLNNVLDALVSDIDVGVEEKVRNLNTDHRKSIQSQSELMMEIEKLKTLLEPEQQVLGKSTDMSKLLNNVEKFKKSHEEDVKMQHGLLTEIKHIKHTILPKINGDMQNNPDLTRRLNILQQQSIDDFEYQREVENNIKALKTLIEQTQMCDNSVFDEKMRKLYQDQHRNLQNQIEMMAQIDEMKKIYELDKMNEKFAKSSDETKENLKSIKRDHDKAFLKQKQMINDIELIKMNILSEQQKDDEIINQLEKTRVDNEKQLEDQRHYDEKLDALKEAIDSLNQETDIEFEEDMGLIIQEHNRRLDHQSELMRQIEEIKAMYFMDK